MGTFNNIIPLTKKWEGGLSRNKKDTASKYPSPYIYKGSTGWHTNKGITYPVFVTASKKFGFENNAKNFLTMPDEIWNKIAKGFYWDKLKLDNLKSDAISFQLFSWLWGAGTGWYNRMQKYLFSKGIKWNKTSDTLYQAINILIQNQGEKKTVDELQQQQVEFYKSINQPAFEKGWINRVIDTTKFAYNYLTDEFTQALRKPVQEVTKITQDIKKKLPEITLPKMPDVSLPDVNTVIKTVKKNKSKAIFIGIAIIGAYMLFKSSFGKK